MNRVGIHCDMVRNQLARHSKNCCAALGAKLLNVPHYIQYDSNHACNGLFRIAS